MRLHYTLRPCGHLHFATSLLHRCPNLSNEFDALHRLPIHLAAIQGHAQLVGQLLDISKDSNSVRDQDGKTPLHLAAMKGRVDVIKVLVGSCPESTGHRSHRGETASHLCVRYNQLEALKLLVLEATNINEDFVNVQDDEGHTILHLATFLKQMETVRYLVSVPRIKAKINALNGMGFTALDLLEHCPRDFKSLEIGDILMKADGLGAVDAGRHKIHKYKQREGWFGALIEMSPNEDNPSNEDYMLQLYRAAFKGSVATLTALIRNDPLILQKLSLTSLNETPLHISALARYLEFTEALLSEKPQLASTLDSRKRSPLHLASAEGHTEIVKALLRVNIDVCMAPDEEGRIPLHLAVMRGQVEVIRELINAQPYSILEKLNGNTVLHLAVKYNQLKALRQLVAQLNRNELFDSTDHLGNTILHSAVMLKKSEIIGYLVSVSEVKAKINALNRMGFSALDLLEHYPRDFKSLEIGDTLIKAGSRRSTAQDPNPPDTVPTQSRFIPVAVGGETQEAVKSRFSTLGLKEKTKSAFSKCKSYLRHQSNWVEEMQGTLMLVATLTATISFQVAISPPGGVWQQDYTDLTVGDYRCEQFGKCVAGNAVLGYVYPDRYLRLTSYAIISFIASLSVVLLAISGLPLKNKLCTWLMTIAMMFAITFVLLTFETAMALVTPNHIYSKTSAALSRTKFIWVVLVGLLVVFATVRLLFWLVSLPSKLIRLVRKKLCPTKNRGPIC
ncbi:hypothetical protein DITRI_Ditri02bG0077500 [Diplodiscus trichospermus]